MLGLARCRKAQRDTGWAVDLNAAEVPLSDLGHRGLPRGPGYMMLRCRARQEVFKSLPLKARTALLPCRLEAIFLTRQALVSQSP